MGQKLSLSDLQGSSYQVIMVGLDGAGKSTVLYRLKTDQYISTTSTVGFNCERVKVPCSGSAKDSTFAMWDIGCTEKLRSLWRSYIRHADTGKLVAGTGKPFAGTDKMLSIVKVPCSGSAKDSTFAMWDIGGTEKLRSLWRSYIRHADALVFVVDSSEPDRFEEARLELANLLRASTTTTGSSSLSSLPVLLLANKQDLPRSSSLRDVEAALGLADLPGGQTRPKAALACCAVTGENLDDGLLFETLTDMIGRARTHAKAKKKGHS